MADLYYIDDDYYTPDGYFVYTADAASAISATATIACEATRIQQGDSQLTATATLSAQAVKTVDAVIAQTSLFTPAVTAFVTTSASTDLTAAATMTASADVVKTADVTLSTIISLSLQADKFKGTTVALSATATQSTTATEYISYIATSPTPFYAQGRALISTAQTHFGTHSLEIPNATSGAITSTVHGKFNIGSSTDFSIAFWYYPTANSSGTYDDILGFHDGTEGWFVQQASQRGIRFFITDGTTSETDETGTITLTLNAWNWVVITRTSTTLKIFINGTERVSDTTHSQSSGTLQKYLRIGDLGNGSFVGYIDGLHITVGSTISTAVPTQDTEYAIATTKLLMNWNDSSLGNWFDSSLNDLQTGSATLSATATVNADISVLRSAAATLSSQATVAAQGDVTIEAAAALNATATVVALITKTTGVQAALSTLFTISADSQDLDLAAATLAASASITATAVVVKSAAATLSTTATATTTARRLRSTALSLTAQGFVVAVGLDLDLAQAALTATATLTAAARKTVRPQALLTTAATASATAFKIKQFSSTLSSQFSQTCSETKLKDVFISGVIGQVYFRNTVSDSNDYAADQGDRFIDVSVDYFGGDTGLTQFAVAFWASGQGYVWSSGVENVNLNNWIKLTQSGDYVYYFNSSGSSKTLTWSGIDTGANNHYLQSGNKLWVNGVDQGLPTESGSGTLKLLPYHHRLLALQGDRWNPPGYTAIETPQGYVGALGQYVMWGGNLSGVPDFTQLSERQRIYSGGYVDLGSDGTLSGFTGNYRPWDYVRLRNYQDIQQRGQSVGSIQTNPPSWRELTTTVTVSGDVYRQHTAYTATEQDDVGPFEIVATLSAQPITVQVAAAALTATATLSAQVTKLIGIIETLPAQASVAAQGDRTRLFGSQMTVTGSELTIAVKTGRTLVTIETQSQLTAQARYDARASATLAATASITCQAIKTVSAASTQTATAALVTVNGRIRSFDTAIAVSIAQTTQAVKTARTTSQLTLQSTVYATPYTVWQMAAQITAQAHVQAEVNARFVTGSLIAAQATVSGQITKTTRFSANLQAFDFMLAIGTKVTFDPYYQLVVPRELSVKRIRQETAILTVDTENRLNTIQAENMTLTVDRETATWHIPYSPQQGSRRVQ